MTRKKTEEFVFLNEKPSMTQNRPNLIGFMNSTGKCTVVLFTKCQYGSCNIEGAMDVRS